MIYIADKIVPIVVYYYKLYIHNNHVKERLCLAHHRAHTAGRRQDATSRSTTAYRTSRQAANTRTYESHPRIPTPRGDTHRHRHHTSMHGTDTHIEQ